MIDRLRSGESSRLEISVKSWRFVFEFAHTAPLLAQEKSPGRNSSRERDANPPSPSRWGLRYRGHLHPVLRRVYAARGHRE